ncbi:hypothetical protein X773_26025 [Mesorhizobium sp. LSJC285A00]|nr:hypothetical protein X773_26025 [Mesorhizobium sp. LSJC285A00]ESX79963.1 hypothetical protein X757_02550 [Mesorhizobium sp. LSHC414A00]
MCLPSSGSLACGPNAGKATGSQCRAVHQDQDPRAIGACEILWNLMDVTPEVGRTGPNSCNMARRAVLRFVRQGLGTALRQMVADE